MKTKLRSLFCAPEGKILIAADLSQAESWIVAYLSGSERMKRSLNKSDIHSDTAVGLFHSEYLDCMSLSGLHEWVAEGKNKSCKVCKLLIVETERYIGKQNNHANSYGQGPFRMTETINKQSDKPPYVTVSNAQCSVYQHVWHGLYPEVKGVFQRDIQNKLNKDRTIETPYGFRRTFFGWLDEELYKAAYAFIPQSTVCYHFAGAVQEELQHPGGLYGIRNNLCDESGSIRIVNMSHDSLVLECPLDLKDEICEQVYNYLYRPMVIKGEEFYIPVDVETGYNYGSMSSYDLSK